MMRPLNKDIAIACIVLVTALVGTRESAASSRYSTETTGTVLDTYTGLMWQKNDTTPSYTWSDALQYCEGLTLASLGDWRLPDVKELRSLFDDTTGFSLGVFPSLENGGYWTSSSRKGSPNFAWYVALENGLVYTNFKTSVMYVFCVRP